MQTIEKIEKRRRELRFISLFLIYFLSLVVFGLFFFIDRFAGFWSALQFNIFLRTLFASLIIAFIIYLAQKERLQAELTKQLLDQVSGSSERLRKELRHNKFLVEADELAGNLGDDRNLEKLFEISIRYFKADGGVVILKNRGLSWKEPLIARPDDVDPELIKELTKLVGKNGRSFLQPQLEYPDYRTIKSVESIIAVPLRLENRLYGIIAFWAARNNAFDESDLGVLEVLAKQTGAVEVNFEELQTREDQFQGLLALVAECGDEKAKAKKRTGQIIKYALALGRALDLDTASLAALETAVYLRHVDLVANGSAPPGSSPATIATTLGFPDDIAQALSTADDADSSDLPLSAQIVSLSELYVSKAFPPRGRKPAPKNVIAKIEPAAVEKFDPEVLDALKQTVGVA